MAELEKILDECLDRIHNEGISLEECLADHSHLGSDLEPLLRASMKMTSLRQISVDSKSKGRIRTRVLAHAREHSSPKSSLAWRWPQQRRLAFSLLAIVLGFFSTGTALAQRALPGHTLYPLKLWSERVYVSISGDPLNANLHLSNRRAAEYLATSATKQVGEQAYADYLVALTNLSTDLSKDASLFSDEVRLMQITDRLKAQKEAFERAGIEVIEVDNLIKSIESGVEQPPGNPSPIEKQESGSEEGVQKGTPAVQATTIPELMGK